MSKSDNEKTLGNTDACAARQNVHDIVIVGDGDLFQLLAKASSENEGWMKSTKAMQIEGVGCLVQVTTHQRNHDGTNAVAEALTFVPDVAIIHDGNGGRRLIAALSPVAPPLSTLARLAYEAYNKAAGGLTWDGRPIPHWDDLPDATPDALGTREKWEAAIARVLVAVDPTPPEYFGRSADGLTS